MKLRILVLLVLAAAALQAQVTYDRILNDYPGAVEANDAKRYRARAEAMAGGK